MEKFRKTERKPTESEILIMLMCSTSYVISSKLYSDLQKGMHKVTVEKSLHIDLKIYYFNFNWKYNSYSKLN